VIGEEGVIEMLESEIRRDNGFYTFSKGANTGL
jgi:hypothetical protein